MAVVKKKDGRYFCVYYDESGKQIWKAFGRGPEAKKAAKAFDLEIKAKKKKGYSVAEPQKIDITNLTALYLEAKKNTLHPLTYKIIVSFNDNVLYPTLGGKNIASLTKRDLLPVIKKLEERNLSNATINRYLTYLKAILNWGVQNDIIPSNPFAGVKKRKEAPYKVPIVTRAELERLLEVAPEHLAWAMLVTFYTGCRPGPSELFRLKWDDVDWEERTLTIYGSKTERIRKVYLNDTFFELLKEKYKNRDCEYIVSYRGKPVGSLKRAWKTALKKAGITKRLRLYDLRHAFATYMLAHGADLKAVSEMMGHHSTKTTADRYYQLVAELKKDAVDKLPVLKVVHNHNQNIRQNIRQSRHGR